MEGRLVYVEVMEGRLELEPMVQLHQEQWVARWEWWPKIPVEWAPVEVSKVTPWSAHPDAVTKAVGQDEEVMMAWQHLVVIAQHQTVTWHHRQEDAQHQHVLQLHQHVQSHRHAQSCRHHLAHPPVVQVSESAV